MYSMYNRLQNKQIIHKINASRLEKKNHKKLSAQLQNKYCVKCEKSCKIKTGTFERKNDNYPIIITTSCISR